MKGEPEWMTKFRLRSLEIFRKKPMPNWGADLSVIDFENIFYYLKPAEKQKIDRKSTRLNSSHVSISYAVFCLKKKNTALRRYRSRLCWPARCRCSRFSSSPDSGSAGAGGCSSAATARPESCSSLAACPGRYSA